MAKKPEKRDRKGDDPATDEPFVLGEPAAVEGANPRYGDASPEEVARVLMRRQPVGSETDTEGKS